VCTKETVCSGGLGTKSQSRFGQVGPLCGRIRFQRVFDVTMT